MVGQNVPYLGRVKIPVSPGLRSVLVWVLQGGCFLSSYLNAPQMEMVGAVAWEPTARSRGEQGVRSVLPSGQEDQAGYGRSTNFILPRAASRSENKECDRAGIQDSDFPVEAGPHASSVTPSVLLRGTWGSLWEPLALCPS